MVSSGNAKGGRNGRMRLTSKDEESSLDSKTSDQLLDDVGRGSGADDDLGEERGRNQQREVSKRKSKDSEQVRRRLEINY